MLQNIGRLGRHDDLSLRAKPGESLTLDEMRASLPAIFAAQPHESRSKKYIHISTEKMLDALMEQNFLPVEARVSRTRVEGKEGFTNHMLRLRARQDLVPSPDRKVGDVSFEILLRNSHDGSSSYQFMAGLLKLLCLNGLVASDGTVSTVKVRHTGNYDKQIDAVVEGAFAVLEQGPRVLETVEKWRGIELNDDERLGFADSAMVIRFGDKDGKIETPVQAKQLLIPRRREEIDKRSLWDTFNIVQENVIRGGLSGTRRDQYNRPKRTTTREVRGIDADVRYNKQLWALAESFAEQCA